MNNPLYYTDPSGHWECEFATNCKFPPEPPTISQPVASPQPPQVALPAGYQWELLTQHGEGEISFYSMSIVDDSGASSPTDLTNEAHFRLQGSVMLNGLIWNYIVTNAETGEGHWEANDWASSCSPPFASATQCVVPLEESSPGRPVTGAVSQGSPIPMGAEQLIFVQIIEGYPPFFDGGMVVNTRDECPACAALQVDILTRTIGEQFPPYITYNLGNSDADQVYIWIARQHH